MYDDVRQTEGYIDEVKWCPIVMIHKLTLHWSALNLLNKELPLVLGQDVTSRTYFVVSKFPREIPPYVSGTVLTE